MPIEIEKIPGGFRVDGLELRNGRCGCTSVLKCCYSWSKVKKTSGGLTYTGKATTPDTKKNFNWSYTVHKDHVTVTVAMEDAHDKDIFTGFYPPTLEEWTERGWEIIAKEGEREDFGLWRCATCKWLYKERDEETKFEDLPDGWRCPICSAGKDMFENVG